MSDIASKVKKSVSDKVSEVKDRLTQDKEETLTYEERTRRFAKIWAILQGSQDLEKRAEIILNPSNILTSTFLTNAQVEFVTASILASKTFKEFEGLGEYANILMRSSLSREGTGLEYVVRHEQAIGEKRLLQLGLNKRSESNE